MGLQYLHMQVDIAVNDHILAGFFQDIGEDDDSWIKFKYQRLSKFCYSYRALDHVTLGVVLRNQQW